MSYITYEVREYANGHREYWLDGKRHRVNGPAVEYASNVHLVYKCFDKCLPVRYNRVMRVTKKNQTYKFTPKMIEELRVVSEATGIKKNTIVELGTAQKLAELKRNELFTQNRQK